MDRPGTTLSATVVKALTFWPGFIPVPTEPVNVSAVLVPFFNELLDELPWWNPAWRVTQVRAASPCCATVQGTRLTEVAVPGWVGAPDVDPLPFSGRVRFEGDRLVRFQAKIGEVVVGPAVTAAGKPEPDPFAAVVRALMDLRQVSVRTLAERCGLSIATVRALRDGWSPDPVVVERVAAALDTPADELLAVAGHEAPRRP